MRRLPVLACTLLLCGCGSAAPELVHGCVAEDPLVPVCGFQHPEDMELLPDGHTLLISQMGGMDGSLSGSLAFYDTASGTITRLPVAPPVATGSWGAAQCLDAPGAAFSPHGIDLLRRADGALELFVVNHGGRESVELFEVNEQDGAWQLAWRGCVIPPANTWMNDVAALPSGEFVVSHMFPRDALTIGPFNIHLLKGMLGIDTGFVLRCSAQSCAKVAGTDAPFPNGVQVDADGKTLYLNAYMGGEVRKIALADGRLLGSAAIKSPDNSQWDASGHLLVASHLASGLQMSNCFDIQDGACGAEFEIVELDPATMQTRSLLRHEGPPMGAATVAQQVGDELFLGSFTGDRILRLPMPR